MSNLIFPQALKGLDIKVTRTPYWSTEVLEVQSGKEQRAAWWSTPRIRYQVAFNFLREALNTNEAATLGAFFMRHRGRFESFLLADPDDSSETAMGFGVGNGSATAFQLQRRALGLEIDALGTWPAVSTPRTNLLTYSQDYTNAAWPKVGASVGAAVTAPDGMSTALTITEDTTNGVHCLNRSGTTPGTLQTYSVYAKAAGRAQIALQLGNVTAYFDVSAGTVVSGAGTITAVGNGWYRCSVTGVPTNSNTIVYLASGGSVTYTGTSQSCYLWGAQCEAGAVATRYIPTTTAAVTVTPAYYPAVGDGFEPVTEPGVDLRIFRQDWGGNQEMFPTARTNILTYSEQFDNAAWSKTNATVTANGITAPDSTSTADKIQEDGSTAEHRTTQAFTAPAGTVTGSVYLKAGERSWAILSTGGTWGGGVLYAYFNLTSGVVGNVDAGITASIVPLGNGWYRCSITATATAGVSSLRIHPTTANGTVSYAGTVGSGIYAWGAQLEASPVATGYIPTTTAAVTRTDYTLGASGAVTFAVAPVAGAALTWSGTFYRRVRFDEDTLAFERALMDTCAKGGQTWEAKTVKLVSVK